MIAIKLKKGKEISLLRKHPWVFSGAIQFLPKSIADGDLVIVNDADGQYLATGFYQGGGSIAVRVISFEDIDINQVFWDATIANAKMYRQSLGLIPNPATNAYRLMHGEGDNIPGLIIDIYHDLAVIQCHAIGIHKSAKDIATALKNNFGDDIQTIYVRCKETLPSQYAESIDDGFLLGSNEEVTIVENDNRFKINVITGQKTGFFLDQRENRALVGHYAKDKSVLNCFCYTGGFTMYAIQGGASLVVSADISQKAMDLLEENLSLNPSSTPHQSHTVNVMQYLADPILPTYDIVVVDPPAFAKSVHKRHNAVQAYKRLNALAIKKVAPGGMLFTFSCSQVVGTQLFYDTIVAAGMESSRKIRVVQSLSQGPDHPINLFHPEGHYLKGLLLYID